MRKTASRARWLDGSRGDDLIAPSGGGARACPRSPARTRYHRTIDHLPSGAEHTGICRAIVKNGEITFSLSCGRFEAWRRWPKACTTTGARGQSPRPSRSASAAMLWCSRTTDGRESMKNPGRPEACTTTSARAAEEPGATQARNPAHARSPYAFSAKTSSFRRSGMSRYSAGSMVLVARPWVIERSVVV